MPVAIITARGGSKRIPGKNIKEFMGKPMIAWPIEAAQRSGVFDEIVVSTNSEEIASVAREYSANVPFMRPEELSDDFTPTAPVLEHAICWLRDNGTAPDYACCIYPTSPFILESDLKTGLEMIKEKDAPGALSVTSFDFPILRGLKVCDDGSVAFNWPEHELTRSQDLPEFYHDAGQFYWVNCDKFIECKKIIMPGMLPVVLPRKRVQDLDTPEDWEMATLMAKAIWSTTDE